jgi:hypothetical protein
MKLRNVQLPLDPGLGTYQCLNEKRDERSQEIEEHEKSHNFFVPRCSTIKKTRQISGSYYNSLKPTIPVVTA